MELVLDRTYRVYRFFLDNVIGYAAAIIMLGAVTLAVVEIIRRYFFGLTYEWGQDAIVYFTVGSIYLYFAVTQGRRSHLAVTALLDVFKSKGMHKLVLILRTIVTAFGMTLYGAIVYWREGRLPVAPALDGALARARRDNAEHADRSLAVPASTADRVRADVNHLPVPALPGYPSRARQDGVRLGAGRRRPGSLRPGTGQKPNDAGAIAPHKEM